MADLRLVGGRLSTVRRLAEGSLTRGLLWRITSKDFKVAELMALPADQRAPIDPTPQPLQGRPPRQWEHLDRPAPAPAGSIGALHAAWRSGQDDPAAAWSRLDQRMGAGDFGRAVWSPFVALDREGATRAAEAAAARWRAGAPLGPLDGVPVPVKDEVDMTGLPTRGGTRYLQAAATSDAWVVRKLRDAGALVYAKTHCTEWGMNPLGFSDFLDMPRNAWSSEHGAGGSSTGSGVAVALGFAPVALGSDGGGSIRIPASLNGVYGLKPTWIRIGRTGDLWGAGTMPHLGPLGRSTSDLAAFLAATAGPDPDDAASWAQPAPDPAAWQRALSRGVKGCRIGVVRSEWADCPAGLADPARAALDALAKQGAILVDVDIPLAPHGPGMGALTIASESSAGVFDDYAAFGDDFGEEMRVIVALLGNVTAREFLLVQRTRATLRRQAAAVLRDVDVLAMPVTAQQAAPYPQREARRPVMDTAATARMTRYAFFGNLTGLPAGTAPVGVHDGLPVGLQIIGDAWDEASVLAVMAEVERLGLAAPIPT